MSPLGWSKPASYLKDHRLAIHRDKLCNAWSQSINTLITVGITGLALPQSELDQLNPKRSYFYKHACSQPLGVFKCFTNYFNVASQRAWHEGEFTLALKLLCAQLPELCMPVLNFECTSAGWVWKLPLTFASVRLTDWSKVTQGTALGSPQHHWAKTTRTSGCSSEGFLDSTDRNVWWYMKS